jgi:serine/threonine protein phosphatase 1
MKMMLGFPSRRDKRPAGARGYRAYVIGDIHGRLDLLEDLLAKIHAELQHHPSGKTLLVFVGDLIDRGPNSAQVIERLRTYRRLGVEPVFILGNHEEVLLRILGGDTSLISSWLQFGGLQCLQSYGVNLSILPGLRDYEVLAVIRRAIPKDHAEFLETFADSCRFGDYLFVHAGIRPGVQLEQQAQYDMRWIREPFLLDETNHGYIVVHGHTISDFVEERSNRIGIDTGAYRTGVLTALALEGADRWLLDTRPAQSRMAVARD